MLKKIVTNTLANYVLKLLQIILNIIAIPVLVSHLGEESFGIILFAGVVVGYFNILDLGIANGVTKYVSQYLAQKNYTKINDIINTALNFFIGVGLFVGIIISLWALLGGVGWLDFDKSMYNTYTNTFLIAGIMAVFSWPQMLLKGVFKGIQDFTTLNITLGIGRVISIALAIFLTLYTKVSLEWIFIAFNLDKIILVFFQYGLLKKKIPFWTFRFLDFKKTIFKEIFAFSSWIMLGQIAVMLEYQADQLIILGFLSASFITVYTIIFYLFRLIQQVSGLAASAIMPAISQINETDGKKGVDKYIYKGIKYHNLLFVPITITCYFLAEPFVRLWMGEKYLEYIWLIKMSIAFQLLWQSGAMLGQIYMGAGYSRKPGVIAIIVGVLNVVTSIILVNYIGVEGVILGTIMVGALSVPVAMWWMLPDLKIKFIEYFYNIIFKAQFPLWICGALLLPLNGWIKEINNWWLLGLVAGTITMLMYAVGIFTVVDKQDRMWIKNKLSFLSHKKSAVI